MLDFARVGGVDGTRTRLRVFYKLLMVRHFWPQLVSSPSVMDILLSCGIRLSPPDCSPAVETFWRPRAAGASVNHINQNVAQQ